MKIEYPPYFDISYLPTPLIALKNLQLPNQYKLILKRDDLTGIELSGNKIRKLDFLIKDAIIKGSNRLITCGGLQSNHCRATAFVAKKYGLGVTLVLRGSEPEIKTGNFLLSQLTGAEIIFVNAEEYKNANKMMQDYADNAKENVYIIPEGGSNALGAWGYVRCFDEITTQISAGNLKCQTIVVASGSGGTHAGLLIGKLLRNSTIDIVSINVCDDAAYFQDKINGILQSFNINYNANLEWLLSDIQIIDGFVGAGYSLVSGSEEKLIVKYIQKEGIIFDPVYTAKAFNGMLQMMEQAKLPGKDIIFIHTGGVYGLFPFWQELTQTVL